MNIKDIAQLAGVSISTVSKIVNNKDENINQKTRERVLQIVKEYNYTPYSKAQAANKRSFLLGILVNGLAGHAALVEGITRKAREHAYIPLLCDSRGNPEDEVKNISALCANQVDFVLWEWCGPGSSQHSRYLEEQGIPYGVLNPMQDPGIASFTVDYAAAGYHLTGAMAAQGHSKIGCLTVGKGPAAESFYQGYRKCLFDRQIVLPENLRITEDEGGLDRDIFLGNISGVVCQSEALAARVAEEAAQKNYRIPGDISLACLSEQTWPKGSIPPISHIRLPLAALGEAACSYMIRQVEQHDEAAFRFDWQPEVEGGPSIGPPPLAGANRILVVGSINMDNIVNVGEMPQGGQTLRADSCIIVPGGKGANQAVGAARLGAEVVLIGKVGRDYDGQVVFDSMHYNHVDAQGLLKDSNRMTGRAFIHVWEDGESSITIVPGANAALAPADIEQQRPLFERAAFCLIQTEIPMDTVERAAEIAKESGAQILLKPSAAHSLSDALLKQVDILIPNRKEMQHLCPQRQTLEEQAAYFLDKGVGTVLVTLGHEGCFLHDGKQATLFPAADFEPVDTTGAADAFIAALAVYLSGGTPIAQAIRIATVAAGFSVTRQGAIPALADRNTLELYLSKQGAAR